MAHTHFINLKDSVIILKLISMIFTEIPLFSNFSFFKVMEVIYLRYISTFRLLICCYVYFLNLHLMLLPVHTYGLVAPKRFMVM